MVNIDTGGSYEQIYKFRVILSKCSSRDVAPLMCVRESLHFGQARYDKSLVWIWLLFEAPRTSRNKFHDW